MTLQQRRTQGRLDASGPQLAPIDDEVRDAPRGDRGRLEQQVGDPPPVIGAFELQMLIEEGHISARLDLVEGLGLDTGISGNQCLHESGYATDRGSGVQYHVPIPIARPVAGTGPAAPELDLIEDIAQVSESVRGRGVGEDIPLGSVAVGTGAVGAHPADKGQPLVERHDLLISKQRVIPEVTEDIRAIEHGSAVRRFHAR